MTTEHDKNALFFQWSPNDKPFTLIRTRADDGSDIDAAWKYVREFYARDIYVQDDTDEDNDALIDTVVDAEDGVVEARCEPLERIIEIAREHEVCAVIVERRYTDLDWRSEHASFFSSTFRRYPSICHRLHFFSSPLKKDLSDIADHTNDYVGYSVLRPLEGSPVGRTMLATPPELAEQVTGVVSEATDRVHILGHELTVTGVPFISQDAQYFRCAHAALWMVLYHAYLVHRNARALPHEIHDAAKGGIVLGRQLPSEGASQSQLLLAMQQLGLSPTHIKLPHEQDDSANKKIRSLFAIVCRYVNSQMPPMVHSRRHVWVVVGYARKGRGHENVELWIHDDRRGPYIKVSDPWDIGDNDDVWLAAIPPLPRKVYLTGERAEVLGKRAIVRRSKRIEGSPLPQLVADDKISWRTYAIKSTDYLAGLSRIGQDASSVLSELPLPRYLWVVEAIDADAAVSEDPDPKIVYAEAVVDSTTDHVASTDTRAALALYLHGDLAIRTVDHEEAWNVASSDGQAYASGGPVF